MPQSDRQAFGEAVIGLPVYKRELVWAYVRDLEAKIAAGEVERLRLADDVIRAECKIETGPRPAMPEVRDLGAEQQWSAQTEAGNAWVAFGLDRCLGFGVEHTGVKLTKGQSIALARWIVEVVSQ